MGAKSTVVRVLINAACELLRHVTLLVLLLGIVVFGLFAVLSILSYLRGLGLAVAFKVLSLGVLHLATTWFLVLLSIKVYRYARKEWPPIKDGCR
jgi:type III secretory pathway component EscU